MTFRGRAAPSLALVVLAFFAHLEAVHADETAPAAVDALRSVMASLSLAPLCETTGTGVARCQAELSSGEEGPAQTLVVTFSAERGLLTVAIPRLAVLRPDARGTNRALRRLWSIQATLELTRLEWDPTTGEVRVAVVLPSAGGIDTTALRRAIQETRSVATRLAGALREIAADAER